MKSELSLRKQGQRLFKRMANEALEIINKQGIQIDEQQETITHLTKRVEELEKGLRKIEKIKWGNDGDCGALNIINELIDD